MAHHSPPDCMHNITQSYCFVKSIRRRECPLNFLTLILILRSQGRFGFWYAGGFRASGTPSFFFALCSKTFKKPRGVEGIKLVLNYTEINRHFKGGVFSKGGIDKGRQAKKDDAELKVLLVVVITNVLFK